MSTTIFHRRRAERFAQLLDEANGGRRHHTRSAVDDQLTELVGVGHRVSALRHSVDVQVDPEFRVGLRAMLVAAAEREAMGGAGDGQETIDLRAFRAAAQAGKTPARTARRLRTRGAIIVGVACGAIAVSGMSAASENAVPGDALYGVKRQTERAQLALASSDLTKGQLFVDFARTRVSEAEAVVDDPNSFARVLDDMDSNTLQGVKLLTTTAVRRDDPAALDVIDEFLRQQRPAVAAILGRATAGSVVDRAERSNRLLVDVQQRVEQLRESLACQDTKATKSDDFGPQPFACTTATAPLDSGDRSGNGSTSGDVRPEKSGPAAKQQPATGKNGGPSPAAAVEPSAATSAPPSTGADPAESPSAEEGGLVDDIGELLGGLLD